MKRLLVLFVIIPLISFSYLHKFYVSVTQIEYVKDKNSVQIISRVFIDDFEQVLREQFDESITLMEDDNEDVINKYIDKYYTEHLKIKINGNPMTIKFIGKAYDVDVVKSYLEIQDIKNIQSFEIMNDVLVDLFPDQQNIIKTKINTKQKSFILDSKDQKMLLKFN